MDAGLIARELEMALLAKILETPVVNANSNWQMRAPALLYLLRQYLGDHVTLDDLHAATQVSPMLTWEPYEKAIEIAGVESRDGVRLSVRRWSPVASVRAPFEAKLREHASRPRPPIAATRYRGGVLSHRPCTVEIRNEGYGTPTDIQVTGINTPDWVTSQQTGTTLTLTADPPQGGVYRGVVKVTTTANDVHFPVIAQKAVFTLPDRDQLGLDECLGHHPDLDRTASEILLEKQLVRLGYERLPGGLFLRHSLHSVTSRTPSWWLTEADITTGRLPATGYPTEFQLYIDEDGRPDRYVLNVTVHNQELGGEFPELFDLIDAQPGQQLTLSPYRGGFKAALSPAQPWRTASGHTFWLQGPRDKVLTHPDVTQFLLSHCDDKNITVNLLLFGEGELPADLIRQHRAGRLTIRWAPQATPFQLVACGRETVAFSLPFGSAQPTGSVSQLLWESAQPLQGQDYRELAWQRSHRGDGSGENGLIDLELSVGMTRLADAVKPAPITRSVRISPADSKRLLEVFPRLAREFGADVRPVAAAPLLKRLGLTADQVNAGANGYRVTAGGYLVRRPQDIGRQRDWTVYIGALYGGVIHHSQLRKLVEVFSGNRLEATSFVTASLQVMGWAGNGYRRPRQPWEPTARELTPFVAEILARFGNQDAALDWLRRHLAASETQLTRALTKAEALPRPQIQPVEALPSPRTLPKDRRVPQKAQVNPAPSTSHSPLTGSRKPPRFAPLPALTDSLPDPRQAPAAAVRAAVIRLIAAEAPMTDSWLIRRYALLAKLNPKQVERVVIDQAEFAASTGQVIRTVHAGGWVDYTASANQASLREKGSRQAVDIPLAEWCELLRSLGLQAPECDEHRAFTAAAAAYKFGAAAAPARSLIALAWQIIQQEGYASSAG